MRINLTIPAVPIAQPRPRAVNRGAHAGVYEVTSIGKGKNRKPHPITAFKATARQAAQSAYRGPPLRGPLHLECVFVLPRPVGMVWKRKAMPRVPHIKKPDLDNLLKAVLDCLNQVVFGDDSHVCEITCSKWIASGEEQPHVKITIVSEEADG